MTARPGWQLRLEELAAQHLGWIEGVDKTSVLAEGDRVTIYAFVPEHHIELQGAINEAEEALAAALPGYEVEVVTRAHQGRLQRLLA